MCAIGKRVDVINFFRILEDLGVEKSTPELLRTDKQFVKLIHKQGKEMEGLKKRHNKERTTMQRSHCAVVDKMTAAHNKERTTEEKSSEKQLKKKGWDKATICCYASFNSLRSWAPIY